MTQRTNAAKKTEMAISETQYAAPALEKGLDIIELLATERDGITQSGLAQRLDRSSSEIFRMLNVLERRDYVQRHSDGTYTLTLRLFNLVHLHPPLQDLLSAALPVMKALALSIQQSCHLVITFGGRIMVVAQVSSPKPMGYTVRLGASFPISPVLVSARVLTSYLPDRERADAIKLMLQSGDGDMKKDQLIKALEDIKAQGYCESSNSSTAGIIDLSAPVSDHTGQVLAALTVPYLKQFDTKIGVQPALDELIVAAQRISAQLGSPGNRD